MHKNESKSPDSTNRSTPLPVRQLAWADLPGCIVLVSEASPDGAIVFMDGREQVALLLFRESARGLVDVVVPPGTVPNDKALLAMGRTIMAHLAAVPEWRDAP